MLAFSFKSRTLREQVGYQIFNMCWFRCGTEDLRPVALCCEKFYEQGKGSICAVYGKIPLSASADSVGNYCSVSK